jgi:hypothetical protein
VTDWMTITILESGLTQRVRKAAISTYGHDGNYSYVVKEGRLIHVKESPAILMEKLELEEKSF